VNTLQILQHMSPGVWWHHGTKAAAAAVAAALATPGMQNSLVLENPPA
jgi:hypothetical protein